MKKKIWDHIEKNAANTAKWLSEFVAIPSVNNSEVWDVDNEKAAQEWMAQKLSDIGLEVDMWAVDPLKVRPNVVGTWKGAGGGRDLLLNGHCDVVPVYQPEKWDLDPFSGAIVDGKVYGRGSCDMKGGLIALVAAVDALKKCGVKLRGDVFLSSSPGEESGEGATIGAAAVVKRGYKAPFALVAESTDLTLLTASTGIFMFEFIVRGKAVHGACRNQVIFPQPYGVPCGPEVGVDALDKAIPFIQMFRRMETEWNQVRRHPVVGAGGSPGFDTNGVGVFCISPSFIEGGIYRSSINPIVKITYYVWYPPTRTMEDVIAEIRSNVTALSQTDAWLRENPPEIIAPSPRKPWPPFETPMDHEGVVALKKSFKEVMGKEVNTSGLKAVADCTWFNLGGVPSVLLGPGNAVDGVHGDNECVKIADIVSAAKIYAGFIMDWCGVN
jgi:acetylornithine deacetylase